MATRDARAFFDKVRTDASLGGRVRALADTPEEQRIEALMRVANEAGFECSANDLLALGQEVSNELSEGQLDQVAGGLSLTTSPQLKQLSPSITTFNAFMSVSIIGEEG